MLSKISSSSGTRKLTLRIGVIHGLWANVLNYIIFSTIAYIMSVVITYCTMVYQCYQGNIVSNGWYCPVVTDSQWTTGNIIAQ